MQIIEKTNQFLLLNQFRRQLIFKAKMETWDLKDLKEFKLKEFYFNRLRKLRQKKQRKMKKSKVANNQKFQML